LGKDPVLNDADFEKTVRETALPVLVEFWASWCLPSQMMAPVLDRMREEYVGRVRILALNVDRNPGARIKFGIQGCPTFILFKDGRETTRKIGALSEGQLARLIESAL